MFKKRDIVTLNFPFSDGSSSKLRPCLIVSSEKINKTGDSIFLQITSKAKNDSLSIELIDAELMQPMPLKSYVRVHKIFTVENKLILRKISEVSEKLYAEIIDRLVSNLK